MSSSNSKSSQPKITQVEVSTFIPNLAPWLSPTIRVKVSTNIAVDTCGLHDILNLMSIPYRSWNTLSPLFATKSKSSSFVLEDLTPSEEIKKEVFDFAEYLIKLHWKLESNDTLNGAGTSLFERTYKPD